MKEQSKDQSFHMGLLEVRDRPWGRGAILEIYYDGEHIGEYERTHYSKGSPHRAAQIKWQEKIREVYRAAPQILKYARMQENGKVAVRWPEGMNRKEIRAYDDNNPSNPGENQEVLALIPREIWRNTR